MTPQEEARYTRKMERELAGHRGLQNGRDFRWNVFRFRDEDEGFRGKFDRAFPQSPGSPQWFGRYCGRCGKLPDFCECQTNYPGEKEK